MTVASNKVERLVQRRHTRVFIDAAPLDIVIRRDKMANDTALRGGTYKLAGQELPPQRVRILHAPPRRRRLENNPPHATQGEIPFAKDTLLALWDADLEIGDQFDADGVTYTVTYVFIDRDYETVANLQTPEQI